MEHLFSELSKEEEESLRILLELGFFSRLQDVLDFEQIRQFHDGMDDDTIVRTVKDSSAQQRLLNRICDNIKQREQGDD